MKTIQSLILAAVTALAVLFAPAAIAAGSGTGIITSYYVSNGLIIFYLSPVASGQPACANALHFAFDAVTTAIGRENAAEFRSAFLANKTLNVFGTGSCTVTSNSEDLYYFIVNY